MEDTPQYKIDLEICPTPILLVTENGKIVLTNKRLDQLFGYQSDELIGQSVEVLVPTDVRSHHPDLRNAFFQMPTSRRMGTGRDLNGVRKTGEMVPVEIGLDPIDFNGELMVMVSVLDISERKQSEAMIRAALDAASSGMIQVSESGEIQLVNMVAAAIFGYDRSEMIGQPVEMLIPEPLRRKHAVYRTSYQNDRQIRPMGSSLELPGLRKDGTVVPLEIGLTPVDGRHGKSTMATISDISERILREKHLAQKNQQLATLNQELLQFTYSASHDLKAPLASISGLLQYCENDLQDGDYAEVESNLQRSRTLAERLAQRVEDMLVLAKSDLADAKWEPVDVREKVETIWAALLTDGVTFDTDFAHQVPLHSISSRFETIVENLISNAIKYGNGRVTVRTWNDGDTFHLAVEDNGDGIPAEHHGKVFRLFQRFSDREAGGSGLGLALVKKNAMQLAGSVGFESKRGKTLFTVVLPQDPLGANIE